jgi:hypothetical protein
MLIPGFLVYAGKKEKELKKQSAPAVQKPKVQAGKWI